MTQKIRVLMADDSAAVRRMVSETLSSHDDIEVVAAAKHGGEALQKLPSTRPDVILLDVEMPVMDGIDTLKAIRRRDRNIPILMFSSLTVKGGEATLDALSAGASDYVAKPVSASHVQQAIDYLNTELAPKIREWGRSVRSSRIARPVAVVKEKRKRTTPKDENGPVDIVAIGSSTGGPNALAEVIADLPGGLSVPVVIVQHMPPLFTKLLAERLDDLTSLDVKEATHGELLRPGQVRIAPGDHHMVVDGSATNVSVKLNQGAPENSCRPAVDVLFRSVAGVYGKRALGVVLTGMGKDGVEGCRVLDQKGAYIITQDRPTSVVWGMPRAVSEAGLSDVELPIQKIPGEISRRVKRPIRTAVPV